MTRGMRLLLAVLLPAIGVLGAAHPARAQVSELRIAVQPGILFYSMWIMKQAGLAERQAAQAGRPDLKVNWLTMSSGGANADALLSGSVDVVAGGTSNLLIVWSKSKGAVKAISAVSGVPNVLITRDPNVRTLKDFTDKNRIAVPTIKMSLQAIYLQMALEQTFGEGSFKKFDPMMVQLGHAQATLAILDPRNPVDSHFSGPPFMQTALKNPAIHRVLTSVDLVGPSTSLLAYTTAKFYDANPKMIAIFVAALNDANQLIQAEPRKAARFYLDATQEKYSVDEIVTMTGEPGTVFTTVPKGTMKFAEFMHKVGTLDKKPASWKDYFFPSIHAADGN